MNHVHLPEHPLNARHCPPIVHISLSVVALLTAALLAQPTMAQPTTSVVDGVMMSAGGGAAADGKYMMTFAIYAAASGGTATWTEGPTEVAVIGGRFQHTLGTSKPFNLANLAALPKPWLGVKIENDPELTRRPLHSVLYALRSNTAASLDCSGCVGAGQLATGGISADKVGFTWAGSKTKGGPASSALLLECTGCVSVDHLKIDKDLDLGGNGLKAKQVTATSVAAATISATTFIGDGSKLSGIQIPSGTCKNAGDVVKGIGADGSLICIKAMDPSALPPDGIDEISNSLIHNQFVDMTASKNTPVAIPDNNPPGVGDELTFPDIGLAQALDVDVDVANSDISGLTLTLYDPNNAKYVLYDKGATGKAVKTSYPSKTKPVSGDLSTWIGKNPKGKWRLTVSDTKFLNNGKDGAIQSWSVRIQTLSNKKVQVKGDLKVDGNLQVGKSDIGCTPASAGTIRWNGTHFEGCNGNKYFAIKLFVGPGSKDEPAGASCAAIKATAVDALSGLYWLKPDGGAAFEAWCDMNSHDGGWTLTMNLDTNDGATRHYEDNTFWTGSANVGSVNAALEADYKGEAFHRLGFKEIMIKAHIEGSVNGSSWYANTGPYTGKTLQWLFVNGKNTTFTGSQKGKTGSIGSNGHARNAGDAFIDHNHPLIANSTYSPSDAANITRLGTNYASACGTINCNGHNFGGIGGRHYRGGWGCHYEAAQLNGYCATQGAYGTNGSAYKGNNAFKGGGGCGGGDKSRDMDFSIWVR